MLLRADLLREEARISDVPTDDQLDLLLRLAGVSLMGTRPFPPSVAAHYCQGELYLAAWLWPDRPRRRSLLCRGAGLGALHPDYDGLVLAGRVPSPGVEHRAVLFAGRLMFGPLGRRPPAEQTAASLARLGEVPELFVAWWLREQVAHAEAALRLNKRQLLWRLHNELAKLG